ALDAIVALPEQLYSPPSPDESSRDAAKRVEPLVTPDLFAAMSSQRERETNYRLAVVAREQATVRAQGYIDDLGVRNGADSPNSVSRTVRRAEDFVPRRTHQVGQVRGNLGVDAR